MTYAGLARPEDYAPEELPAVDPALAILTRIAVALERLAAGPSAPLAALPPARLPLADQCPVHRVPWKIVPAGVSKRTGKPYAAFAACPEQGCDQRPPQ